MKPVLHEHKKDVFTNWVNAFCQRHNIRYLWPQICYDINTLDILHLVFEKNASNRNFIYWPVINFHCYPKTNLDFTRKHPQLDNGQAWDYHNWHKQALNCNLLKSPSQAPASFWNWRLNTRPQGNLTCDLDFLFKSPSNFYGLEATQIYYVDQDKDPEKDVYEHFKRLFILRKGNESPGFNIKQLQAQHKLVSRLNGSFYLIFHQILNENRHYYLREDKALTLKIDTETLKLLYNVINRYEIDDNLRYLYPKLDFVNLNSFMQELILRN